MYLQQFGLQRNPFSLNAEPRCMYYSASHREAAAQLLFAVREYKGIALLAGDPGTGKTMLLHSVLQLIRTAPVVPCVILNPIVETAQDLLLQILGGFQLHPASRAVGDMINMLYAYLEDQRRMRRRALLVVDEAQQLNPIMLERLRLLSNLESSGQRLLQLVLCGQSEIRKTLAEPQLAGLRQRIVARCETRRLNAEEVWNYMAMRVARAGSDGRMLFQPEAISTLAAVSGGIPRVINVLADNSLIAAYSAGQTVVSAEQVQRMARHFDLADGDTPADAVLSITGFATPDAWKKLVEDYAGSEIPLALQEFGRSVAARTA
ncbi:MAG: AAA family ATPase [Acidobacteriota bacterium]|nr:AAA family ATPase [Acidobacteriota bacterium]